MAGTISTSTRRIPLRVGRAIMDNTVTEKEFQARILTIAKLYGWLCYHVPDSRMVTCRGFPDIVLCKSGRFIMAELKTERGKLRAEQVQWLEALRASGVEAYLWRPSMWDKIVETLKEQG